MTLNKAKTIYKNWKQKDTFSSSKELEEAFFILQQNGKKFLIAELQGRCNGYPNCCVDFFIKNILTHKITYDNHVGECSYLLKDTGFVPCKKHLNQIISGKLKIENLIK